GRVAEGAQWIVGKPLVCHDGDPLSNGNRHQPFAIVLTQQRARRIVGTDDQDRARAGTECLVHALPTDRPRARGGGPRGASSPFCPLTTQWPGAWSRYGRARTASSAVNDSNKG